MASEQSFSTGDLRSAAVDYQRDSDQKHKWAAGEVWSVARGSPSRPEGLRRPLHPQQKVNAAVRRCNGKSIAQVEHRANMARKYDVLDEQNITDSSDDDIAEASAAPEPDAEITYSYDAPRGPGQGSQILSLALAKAVERYEVKETERLVKEEYEVVRPEDETDGRQKHRSVPDTDDGFELI